MALASGSRHLVATHLRSYPSTSASHKLDIVATVYTWQDTAAFLAIRRATPAYSCLLPRVQWIRAFNLDRKAARIQVPEHGGNPELQRIPGAQRHRANLVIEAAPNNLEP